MNARFIVIGGIFAQDPAQVRLPEYDQVVETFPPDRADQSLDVCILPRRAGSRRLVPNAHGAQPLHEYRTVRSVPVSYKIPRCAVPARYQRMIVSGRRIAIAPRTEGNQRQSQMNRQRSVLLSCGRFDTCRRSTLSCWRRTRISTASFALGSQSEAMKCRISRSNSIIGWQDYRVSASRLAESNFRHTQAKEAADKKAGSKVVTKNKQRRAGSV
jgi:hypothetical protein